MNAVAIFIGGGLGSLCRFGLGKLTSSYFVSSFAFATLFSNFICIFSFELNKNLISKI